MAIRMLVFWFPLVLLIVGSHAAGEFSVIYSPPSLQFEKPSTTTVSLLKEIFSASLGLSVDEDSEWDGLAIIDPFTTPEAVVEIHVDGVYNLGNDADVKSHAFPLTVDVSEPDTFEAVEQRIKQRFGNGGNKLVNIQLSNPDELQEYSNILGEIKVPKVVKESVEHLRYSVNEDYQFLIELKTLEAITAQIKSGVISADNITDFYNFRFQSLFDLSNWHGPETLPVQEAKELLGHAIEELTNAFVKAYNGSVLVATVTTDVPHTRRAVRAAQNAKIVDLGSKPREESVENVCMENGPLTYAFKELTNAFVKAYNRSVSVATVTTDAIKFKQSSSSDNVYSEDYRAIFQIFLWLGIMYMFALVATVCTILDINPGRDSINYRLTSTTINKND